MEEHFELLGLSRDASEEEIESKIKSELRLWQRRTTSADLTRRQEAEQRVELLTQARSALLGGTSPRPRTSGGRGEPPSRQPRGERTPKPTPPSRRRPGRPEPPTPEPSRPRPRPEPTASGPGEDLLRRARAALDNRDFRAASDLSRQAHSALGPTGDVWLVQARASAGLGRHQDADYEIRQAFDSAGADLDLLTEIADTYVALGQAPRAQTVYEKLRGMHGGQDRADRGMARIHLANGRIVEAVRLFEALSDRTGEQSDRELLAEALLLRAEQVPRLQRGSRYVVSNPMEIRRMREILDRVGDLTESDQITKSVDAIRRYLAICEETVTAPRSTAGYVAIMAGWLLPSILLALVLTVGTASAALSIFILVAGLVAGTVHTLAEHSSSGRTQWQINDIQSRRAAPTGQVPLLESPTRYGAQQAPPRARLRP